MSSHWINHVKVIASFTSTGCFFRNSERVKRKCDKYWNTKSWEVLGPYPTIIIVVVILRAVQMITGKNIQCPHNVGSFPCCCPKLSVKYCSFNLISASGRLQIPTGQLKNSVAVEKQMVLQVTIMRTFCKLQENGSPPPSRYFTIELKLFLCVIFPHETLPSVYQSWRLKMNHRYHLQIKGLLSLSDLVVSLSLTIVLHNIITWSWMKQKKRPSIPTILIWASIIIPNKLLFQVRLLNSPLNFFHICSVIHLTELNSNNWNVVPQNTLFSKTPKWQMVK